MNNMENSVKNVLHMESITMQFGGVVAVNGLTLDVNEHEIVALIGPNGAGKTTAFNCVTGIYQPTFGSVSFNGEVILADTPQGKMRRLYEGDIAPTDLTPVRKTPDQVTKLGIARTFQNIRLFKDLSVLDNVKAGLHNHYRYSTTAGIFRFPNYFKVEKQMDERAMELLKVFGLDEECDYKASNLPYGKQRKLEIARALATEPKLLLLDEPAAGMNPNETAELMDTIRFVRDNFDMTILLIEHDMKLVSVICEELTVLNFGQVLCQGETGAVLHNPEVVKAYLGE